MNIGKIRKVEIWITSPTTSEDGWSKVKSFLFLRITNSEGVEGWGEAFVLPYRERGVAELILSLASTLNEFESLNPYLFSEKVIEICDNHYGLDFSAASSAIEMSLWDIIGKINEKSLSSLLSDCSKDVIQVYVNTWSDRMPNDSELTHRINYLISEGYKSIKIYPLQNRSPKEGHECIEKIEQNSIQNIDLMLDLAVPKNPNHSLELLEFIKKNNTNIYWIEEPYDGCDITNLANYKAKSDFPIVTGEKQCGVAHFKEVLSRKSADILNPDIAGVGSIVQLIEIADLSDEVGVKVSPHCWDSMAIAASAMMHFCASIKNSEKAEIYPDYIAASKNYCDPGFNIVNGESKLKKLPGLGVSINQNYLSTKSFYYNELQLN
tara:strand:- start:4193 stop:5329 length:1137 start_codon:yes stop_codon:yes gene_type:complete